MLKSKRTKSKSKQQATAETPTLSLKEQLAQKRKAERERKELTRFTTAAAFAAVFFGLLLGLVGGIKTAVGGTFAILCLSLSFKYPRQAIYAFLIYMPLAGSVTYALGNSPLLQLAKDAFYIPALISVVQYCKRNRQPFLIPKAISIPLGILLTMCLLTLVFVNSAQQFTPPQSVGLLDQPSQEQPILMGVLGLKVLLGYLPLIPCTYYLLRKKEDLLFLTRLQTSLVLLCCGLAFIQYLMLLTGRCEGTRNAEGAELFKASLEARCFVGGSLLYSPSQGVIRLPGTFVAPWQWGWFLISSSFFTFATAFSDPAFLWRSVGLGSMASVFVLAVVSGQRIALGLVPAVFVLLLILTGQIANLKRFIPIGMGLAVLLGIGAVTNPAVVQERWDSFIERWNASPPHEYILFQFGFVWNAQKGFLGSGLGRATNSARSLGETQLIETYYPKILHEIGPFGMAAFLILVTTLTIVTFKTYRSLKNRTFRSYGATFWVFVLFISYNSYYYPLDVDPVAVYYWVCAGIILRLPELDRQEKRLAAAENQPQNGKKKQRLNNKPTLSPD